MHNINKIRDLIEKKDIIELKKYYFESNKIIIKIINYL
jgi:hypothetical protein